MNHGRFVPCVVICIGLAIAFPAAAINFQALTPLPLSKTSPSDHVVADFNHDGHLDLVVVMSGISGGDGGVSVLMGDGNGGFSNRDFPTGAYNAWGIGAGDFNADTHLDIALTATVTAAGRASRDIHILLGNGIGDFTEHTTVQALQDAPHAVTSGDFNEDGILDLIIGSTLTTSFHAGSAGAAFGAGQSLGGSTNLSGDQLFTVDFNNDGHLDVCSRQAVYLGAGNGSFTRSAFFTVGAKAAADLNGDGRMDLISVSGSNVQVWFGNGDGTFALNATIAVGTDLVDAVIADFDGNGRTDAAVASSGDTAAAVLLNNGDGTFAVPQAFATGPQPRTIAAADWDEDGFVDLIVPYNNLGDTPSATRLLQIPPAPSPGRLQLGAGAYSVSESALGVTVTVTRTGGSLGIVSVDYASSNGMATAGSDYTAVAGTLTFNDGVLSQSFVVPVSEDTIYEGNETFNITLSNVTGGAVMSTPSSAVVTITDNDLPPPAGSLQFSAASYSVNENGVSVSVTVTRTGGSFGAVGVNYSTSDGSATAASDYTFTSGMLSFADGVLSQRFSISVIDDSVYEGNETLSVTLSNVTGGASLGAQSTAQLAILENDPTPPAGSLQYAAASSQVNENAGGVLITVTRTGGSFGATTVDYATTDGSAKAGSDYTFTSGTLNFADGDLSKAFSIVINDDTQYEGNETLSLTLSNAQGAALGTPSSATVTIVENDPPPSSGSLQFSNATYSVSENGASVSIAVMRTGGSSGAVSVDYATSDGSAAAGGDYTFTGGTLHFADGETSKIFSIAVTDDNQYEGDETFSVSLSNMQGTTIGTPSSTTVTIIENEPPPSAGTLQFSGATYSVDEGAGFATITVTRSGGSAGVVGVSYTSSDDTAFADSDYTATSGALSFAEGETSNTFNVPITDDANYEGDERLRLRLDVPTGGAVLGTVRDATLTIHENDSPPPAGSLQLSGASFAFNEGDGTVTITITRTGGSAGGVGVDFAFSNGSATGGTDFVPSNGNLLLSNGVMSATIELVILDDLFQELPETFVVTLSNATGGAAIGQPGVGEITITDNESPPTPTSPNRSTGGGGAMDVLLATAFLWIVASRRRRGGLPCTKGVGHNAPLPTTPIWKRLCPRFPPAPNAP